MTGFTFRPATKHASRLRLAFVGPAGSGKTYSALAVGTALGERVAVIDTERGSAAKYADLFRFDQLCPDSFAPVVYTQAIRAADAAGYDVVIIDSLSHAWMGKDGALEQVDQHARRDKSSNTFTAWRHVTPQHNQMVDAILGCRAHLIATMRSKTEYVVETDSKGKSVPRKIGMAPIQRDGLEYEFDVVGDLDWENAFAVTKTRCPALAGKLIERPGPEFAALLLDWLGGAPQPQPVEEAAPSKLSDRFLACRTDDAFNELAAELLARSSDQVELDMQQLERDFAALPEGTTKARARKLFRELTRRRVAATEDLLEPGPVAGDDVPADFGGAA